MREQPLPSERMTGPLNLLDDRQAAASWDLARKFADYGLNASAGAPWDASSWEWDGDLFLAKATSDVGTADNNGLGQCRIVDLGLGLRSCNDNLDDEAVQHPNAGQTSVLPRKRFSADEFCPSTSAERTCFRNEQVLSDGDACLTLKLGGDAYTMAEDDSCSQYGKRSRVASPGSQLPVCQVDDCHADLINAKDYHRRHKVCAMHAKAEKASVARRMQRFCQQCSRFHVLQEFDEGKRSCRRRLAGHNKRRRKTQPESTAPRSEEECARAATVLGLINFFYQQAIRSLNQSNSVINDSEKLFQLLRKANSSLSEPNCSLMTARNTGNSSLEQRQPNINSLSSPLPETQALLAVLASTRPEVLSLLLNDNLNPKKACELRNECGVLISEMPQVAELGSVLPQRNQTEKIGEDANTTRSGSPLLSSSLAKESPRTPNGDLSLLRPSTTSSHKFPILSSSSTKKSIPASQNYSQHFVDYRGPIGCALSEVNRVDHGLGGSIDGPSFVSYPEHDTRHCNNARSGHLRPLIDLQKLPLEQTSENSESASDQSPATSEEELQDCTGRIAFKLFDRNPSEIPPNIRNQIFTWLSCRPLNIESIMRPGCVILAVYLFMNKLAWEELLKDLQLSLKKLIEVGDSDFWNKGWVFVQIGRENAFIVDGEVYVNKPLVSSILPQLVSMHPLAVVAGEETKITLKGYNLCVPGISIACGYEGKYNVQKILMPEQSSESLPSKPCTSSECWQELSFVFRGTLNSSGRCFVEVEQYAVVGDFVPIIVAEKEICAEICTLEREIESSLSSTTLHQYDEVASQIRVKAEVRSLLHELGWLVHWHHLQMNCLEPEILTTNQFSFARFKCLVVYAVERDWCAVLKKLLDFFFTAKLGTIDTVLEVGLLHRATQRKCRPIVDMLLAYSVSLHDQTLSSGATDYKAFGTKFIFRPDISGPGGLTPLHVASSVQDAEELVDALTNDSAQVGLDAWDNIRDITGQTPLGYAVARGHHSYIHLVEQKLARRAALVCTVINIPDSSHHKGVDCLSEAKEICLPTISTRDTKDGGNNTPQINLENWRAVLPMHENCLSSRELNDICKASTLRQSCKLCHVPVVRRDVIKIDGLRGPAFRPFMLSMVAIAAVCVCVCLLLKGPPQVLFVMAPFTWESVRWGYS
eukprot:c29019_g1_i1 orf=660-4127(+)